MFHSSSYSQKRRSFGGNSYGRNASGGNALGGSSYGRSSHGDSAHSGSSYGRSSHGGSSHGGSSYGGNTYRAQRSSNYSARSRSFQKGPTINVSRYVNTAAQSQIEEEYVSQHTFGEFGLTPALLSNVQKHGYTIPTPIQDQAIPLLMDGKDVVGVANTGTGKTAAFLLPLIHKIVNHHDQGVLILAPTRELALQIFEELRAFSYGLRIGTTLCIGGANIARQMQDLRQNPHFVIGTPGRVKDLIDRGALKSELFTNVVLDEVDRMLDIGFRKDIMYLISKLPSDRHAALFSATMNHETEEVIQSFLKDPVTVSVKKTATAINIQQKVDVLHDLLIQKEFEKVIVFGRTKHGINKLEEQLVQRGFRVTSIHGNKSQNARQRSLQEFKNGRVKALLATDVAARGIDIEDVSHVINYDEPMTYDDYVHRIGRTGRAGKVGKALTFVSR